MSGARFLSAVAAAMAAPRILLRGAGVSSGDSIDSEGDGSFAFFDTGVTFVGEDLAVSGGEAKASEVEVVVLVVLEVQVGGDVEALVLGTSDD